MGIFSFFILDSFRCLSFFSLFPAGAADAPSHQFPMVFSPAGLQPEM
jgi:hypothetical protein